MKKKKLKFDEQGVEMLDVPDGFVPNSLPKTKTTRIVKTRKREAFLKVIGDALSEDLCAKVYAYTTNQKQPWGEYVSLKEISTSSSSEDSAEKSMAKEIVRSLYFENKEANRVLMPDLSETHGFAIWCLASDRNKEVTYHLDYAEQFRMQTNVIWCPMLASVCNVTPCREGEMIGGEFAANMDGIDHYAKFGHRGRLNGIENLNRNLKSNAKWMRVPYRHRQAILFEGSLPHLSTKLLSLPKHLKRVIIGINVFDTRIGPIAERCTIHSARWRRAQKLYSVSVKYSGNDTKKSNEEKIEISRIREKNPVLYRLLKLKYQREKERKLKQMRQSAVLRARKLLSDRCSSLEIIRECFPKVWLMISDSKAGTVRPSYVRKWMRHQKLDLRDNLEEDIDRDLSAMLSH